MRILKLIALATCLLGGAFAAEEGYSTAISARTLLKTTVDGAGQPIKYPTQGEAEISGVLVEIPPGQNTGWHLHSSPAVAYILEGECTVETSAGASKQFKAGDTFAETVNVVHCGFNRSSKPVKIMMFVIGTKGRPISEKVQK